jgi:hypothetical protein
MVRLKADTTYGGLTQIYEIDSDSDVTVVEHSGPGRGRLIFEGDVTGYLIQTEA